MKIVLPENVSKIIEELEKHGFEGYAVGGCIRDSILGRCPDDWDITTSATPEQVKAIYPRTIDTGIEHGTVKVMMGSEGYEITTYRIDGKYSDGRHPDKVQFTPNLEEDLKRRDFTINAMAYNDKVGLVDMFGGLQDIQNRVIRCVGNPVERFNEDALRIFRAVRFSAQLDFEIEEKTREAIKELAVNLKMISVERIQTELVKMISSAHPEKIRDCYELNITKNVLPEFDTMMETPQISIHHVYNVGEHTIKTMEAMPNDRLLRLIALFHDIAKPDTRSTDEKGQNHFKGHPELGAEKAAKILRRLKFDNDTIYKVKKVILFHDRRPEASTRNMRRLLNQLGEELFPALIAMKYADIAGQSDYMRQEKIEVIRNYEKCFEEIKKEEQCFNLKQLAVGGNDLMDIGIPKGKIIGEKLNALLEMVLENPELNDKEILLSFIRENKV